MRKLPHSKSKEEEADFWMSHDTTAFWDSIETLKEPLEMSKELASWVEHRHEKTFFWKAGTIKRGKGKSSGDADLPATKTSRRWCSLLPSE